MSLSFICYGQDSTFLFSTEDTIRTAVIYDSYIPSVSRQSVPTQVVDHLQMEQLGMQDVADAVKTFSGVSIKDYGGIGGLKTVSIRSMGSQHTAVCYDGITISNAQSGQVDIGRYSLDNVELVTLSIGQADDIFQTARMFASSGALNIRTMAPDFTYTPLHVTALMRYSSFDTYNPYLRYEQRLSPKWALTINGDWLKSKGEYPFQLSNGLQQNTLYRKNSDVNTLRGELNLYGDMGSGGKITFKGNYLDSERGLPGSVVLYNEEATERLWNKNGFGAIHYENVFGKKWSILGNLKYNYDWSRYIVYSEKYAEGKQEDQYTQNEYYLSVATRYQPFSFLNFTIAEDFFINTLSSTISDCPSPTRYTNLSSFAAQYHDKRWTATVSLLATYLSETVKEGDAASDKSRFSPAASISYKLLNNSNLRIRASYKDAFRIPSFNDLYYARVGNRKLKPERATQFNLGLTWSGKVIDGVIDYLSLSADGYFNKVKDKIVARPTMFIWSMFNMGEVNISGVDINLSATFTLPATMSLMLSGSYSYQYAIDMTDPDSKNYKDQIPYTPRHSGNISLSWLNKWINASYTMSAVGKRYSLPQNIDSNMIAGYFEHNLSINHTFDIGKCKLRLQAEALNLSNQNYEVIHFYPMPGFSYRFTIKLTY